MDRDYKERQLSLYRVENAMGTLEIAKICMEHKHYRDSINRCYYSSFYAIKAILALENTDFKRHKDVLAYFNKEHVAKGIFPKDIGKKLGNLQRKREKSDYNDFYIVSAEEAEKQMEATEYIVKNVIEYLEKKNIKKIEKEE